MLSYGIELTHRFGVSQWKMGCEINIQGRELSEPELVQIRGLRTEHPSWHRPRLSRELGELWGWRNEAGRLKDMACRTLLVKLEARGWIELPPREQARLMATVTLLGDDLYAHQPFCRHALFYGFHFLFVYKPESHVTLYQWIKLLSPGPESSGV